MHTCTYIQFLYNNVLEMVPVTCDKLPLHRIMDDGQARMTFHEPESHLSSALPQWLLETKHTVCAVA